MVADYYQTDAWAPGSSSNLRKCPIQEAEKWLGQLSDQRVRADWWLSRLASFSRPGVAPHALIGPVRCWGWPDQERFIRRASRLSIIPDRLQGCFTCWASGGDIPVTGADHAIGAIGVGNGQGVRRAMNMGTGSGHRPSIQWFVLWSSNNRRVKNVRKPPHRRWSRGYRRENPLRGERSEVVSRACDPESGNRPRVTWFGRAYCWLSSKGIYSAYQTTGQA